MKKNVKNMKNNLKVILIPQLCLINPVNECT